MKKTLEQRIKEFVQRFGFKDYVLEDGRLILTDQTNLSWRVEEMLPGVLKKAWRGLERRIGG